MMTGVRALMMLSALFFSAASSVQADRARTALVIGNSDYTRISSLRNPSNDVRDISAVLRELGFQVELLENLDQRGMETAIREFGQKVAVVKGDALFYYAGHGMERNGRNFLIPIGAEIGDSADLKYKAVDVGQVLGYLESARNGVNIIILDACRNNPFRSFRGTGLQGLAAMTGPTGSIIAFATSPGSVAADGEGRNGVFTKHLLSAMRTPGLTVEQTFQEVRKGVVSDTAKAQVPWSNSSVIGDFYFTPPAQVAAVVVRETKPSHGSERSIRRVESQSDGSFLDSKSELLWYCPDDRETYEYREAERRTDISLPPGGTWRLPTKAEFTLLASRGNAAARIPGLRRDPYARFWLAGSSFWLGEARTVRLTKGTGVEVKTNALTDHHLACFVRKP